MNRLQRITMWTGCFAVATGAGLTVRVSAAESASPAASRAQYEVMKQENRFLRTRVLELENVAKQGSDGAAAQADVQKLQDAFLHFEKEKATYQKELESRDQQIADLKADKEKFDARLDEVKQALKAAKSAEKDLADRQKDAMKKASEADGRIADLEKQKADLQSKIEKCAGEMADLLKERKDTDRQYKSRIAELEALYNEAQAAIEKATGAIKDELADTRKQLADATGRLTEKEQEAAALAEAKKQADARIAEISAQARDAEIAVSAAVKPLEKELAGLRKRTEELQSKLADREAQTAKLTADMKVLQDKAEELSILAKEKEAAAAKVVKPLEKQLAELREKSDERERALADKEQLAATLGEKVKALEAEKADWNKSTKSDDLVASLQTKLDKAESRVEKTAAENETLRRRLQELGSGGGADRPPAAVAMPPTPEPATAPPVVPPVVPVVETAPAEPLPTGDADTLLARARAAVAATNAPEAEKFYAAAWQANPENVDASYEYARVLFAKKDVTTAKVVVEQALKNDRRNARMHHLAGMIAVEQRDGKASVSHFEDAVKYAPDNASYRKDLAIEFFNIGRAREAIRNLETVVKLNPRDGETCFNLAAILAQQEKPDMKKAREYYQKALQLGQQGDPALEQLLLRGVSQEK